MSKIYYIDKTGDLCEQTYHTNKTGDLCEQTYTNKTGDLCEQTCHTNKTGDLCEEVIHEIDFDLLNEKSIAWASYKNDINKTGWAYLEIHTNQNVDDTSQAYYAGVLEGYLTGGLITAHCNNKLSDYYNNKDFCEKLELFVDQNLKFINTQIEQARNLDMYWHHIALTLEQMTGVQEGYHWFVCQRKCQRPHITIDTMGVIFLLNLIPDFDGLEEVITGKSIFHDIGEGHCSALVKPLSHDLFVSHNMWSSYSSMLRIIKKYHFNYHILPGSSALIPANTMTFSSYPGSVLSIDDFYVMSTGLVVLETTFEIIENSSLWKTIQPDNIVFVFMRIIVANRLATTGHSWTEMFSRYNSGTYNSQFMIVDYNKFQLNNDLKNLKNDLLWIVEQLPGVMKCSDVTEIVRDQGYWASYNIPYNKDIYHTAGYDKLVRDYGYYFDYDKTPRSQIFKRDHVNVVDLKSLYKLMRYNNFKEDPLSKYPNCTPNYSGDLAIAGRNDLNDPSGIYSIPSLGLKGRGAIDAKFVNVEMVKKQEILAVSGPTDEMLPTFQWSTAHEKIRCLRNEAQPDKWDFNPVHVKWLPFEPEEKGYLKEKSF